MWHVPKLWPRKFKQKCEYFPSISLKGREVLSLSLLYGQGTRDGCFWISLEVQWLRILRPMQWTQIRSLVWEDSTCHRQLSLCTTASKACTPEDPRSTTGEGAVMRSLCTATREELSSLQLEKVRARQRRPSTAINEFFFFFKTDIEAETPVFWPPDAKSWLFWKDTYCQSSYLTYYFWYCISTCLNRTFQERLTRTHPEHIHSFSNGYIPCTHYFRKQQQYFFSHSG